MICSNILPDIPSLDELDENILNGALRASKEVQSGAKQIKLIMKQYTISEVAFAGEGYFTKTGEFVKSKPKESYKYKIVYWDTGNPLYRLINTTDPCTGEIETIPDGSIKTDQFVWCFN